MNLKLVFVAALLAATPVAADFAYWEGSWPEYPGGEQNVVFAVEFDENGGSQFGPGVEIAKEISGVVDAASGIPVVVGGELYTGKDTAPHLTSAQKIEDILVRIEAIEREFKNAGREK